jgi:hypothetical protein
MVYTPNMPIHDCVIKHGPQSSRSDCTVATVDLKRGRPAAPPIRPASAVSEIERFRTAFTDMFKI